MYIYLYIYCHTYINIQNQWNLTYYILSKYLVFNNTQYTYITILSYTF